MAKSCGCCGCLPCCRKNKEDDPNQYRGFVEKRKCRDVFWLILFIVFWLGMFAIGIYGFVKGVPQRLYYGTDYYGQTCGVQNKLSNGTSGADLTNKKYLYYIDPLQLLSTQDIYSSKSICVSSCPNYTSMCNVTGLPCTDTKQYRCEYYSFGYNQGRYAPLKSVDKWSTDYFGDISTSQQSDCSQAEAIPKGTSVNDDIITAFGGASTTQCSNIYQLSSQLSVGPCYPVYVKTYSYLNRCFPQFSQELLMKAQSAYGKLPNLQYYEDTYKSVAASFQRFISDITNGILIIIIAGLVGGLVFSIFWLLMLRFIPGVMVWASIIGVGLTFSGFTVLCYMYGGAFGYQSTTIKYVSNYTGQPAVASDDIYKWKIIAYVMTGITCALFLLTLLMIRRIGVAIACLKTSSRAIKYMPTIFLFPFIPFLIICVLVVWWVFVTAYLYSTGEIKQVAANPQLPSYSTFIRPELFKLNSGSPSYPQVTGHNATYYSNLTPVQCANDPTCGFELQWTTVLQYFLIYHLFGGLWTIQVVIGFGYVVISGSIAQFYWAGGERKAMVKRPILLAMRNAFKYHLGSICLAALVLAIIQFIRLVLEFLDRKLKALKLTNPLVAWTMNIIRCLMWFLEKIVKFINKNAYIVVATKGHGYCKSVGIATTLIISNALTLATVNVIGDILIFMGNLICAAFCGCIAFLLSEAPMFSSPVKYPQYFVSDPILAIAVSVFIGFVISVLFFQVYNVAIDTIIICYCEDVKENDRALYAPKEFDSIFGGHHRRTQKEKKEEPDIQVEEQTIKSTVEQDDQSRKSTLDPRKSEKQVKQQEQSQSPRKSEKPEANTQIVIDKQEGSTGKRVKRNTQRAKDEPQFIQK